MDRFVDELKFQSKIVEEVNLAGGVAWKNNNAFIASIPDVFFKLPNYPAAQVEAKSARPLVKSQAIQWKTTPLQMRMMAKLRAAGMITGVVVVYGPALNKCVVGFMYDYTITSIPMSYVSNNFLPIQDIKEIGGTAAFICREHERMVNV